MTRRQLAKASGTSERYLALLESGSGNPSLAVIAALATALDLAIVELLPRGGERSEVQAEAAAALRRFSPERLAAFHEWAGAATHEGEKGRRILLVGLRGAGKSSLGTELAERLRMPFFELSKEVEKAYGGPIGLLIELSGQSALRRYEREAWDAIRDENGAAVIAAPGGVVADPPLYGHMLETAHSIWLQAKPEDHMGRVMEQGDFRPMASNRSAMADLKAILDARSADYARAEAAVDTSAGDFSATAERLERAARRLLERGAI
jgi:XRE family aerobic/anaerobic benzoate catabolism transcriptional regulator